MITSLLLASLSSASSLALALPSASLWSPLADSKIIRTTTPRSMARSMAERIEVSEKLYIAMSMWVCAPSMSWATCSPIPR